VLNWLTGLYNTKDNQGDISQFTYSHDRVGNWQGGPAYEKGSEKGVRIEECFEGRRGGDTGAFGRGGKEFGGGDAERASRRNSALIARGGLSPIIPMTPKGVSSGLPMEMHPMRRTRMIAAILFLGGIETAIVPVLNTMALERFGKKRERSMVRITLPSTIITAETSLSVSKPMP